MMWTNWVVGIGAEHGNPYDGTTLKPALEQVERLTGIKPKKAVVDRGFRVVDHHPEGVEVILPRTKKKVPLSLKKLLFRRSAIEPVIGHLKSDHRLERNYLKGKTGDQIHAILCGAAFNLRKLLRVFFLFIFSGLVYLISKARKASGSPVRKFATA